MNEGYRRLLDQLQDRGSLTDRWRPVFEKARRELFVPDDGWVLLGDVEAPARQPIHRGTDSAGWLAAVHSDAAIVTQLNDGQPDSDGSPFASSSNSEPGMVAVMLGLADLADGMSVLEIGTGTGWTAALLSARLGDHRVTSVEVDQAVAESAAVSLNRAGFSPTLIVGDGMQGYEPGSPYDRVLATLSVLDVPYPWVAQTRAGGRILTPWRTAFCRDGRYLDLHVGDDGIAVGRFVGNVILWFMMARAQRESWDDPHGEDEVPGEPAEFHPYGLVVEPDAQFAVGLKVPNCHYEAAMLDDEPHTHYRVTLSDLAGGSWATVTTDPDQLGEAEVRQHGPRRLWDEVHAAYRWWEQRGKPDPNRFGVTVTPDGQRVWLDHPGVPVES